ncbi:Protein Red [Seminavis robusta]|uniref:Protein Red n=1 Tax=Seminavis robusta TaxID=568900 RepID=A0A9N8EHL3_9STRA|nr:Protein Red [Seminavis robusta]|eukprot:Sro1015_g231540.1 Protein Red (338) ;mRNA; f:25278-26291
MDNNAFKDLVRSKVKSTKQIAREAVEQAFAKKNKTRKRRRRDDDDLDSSDSDTEKGKKSKKGKYKSNRKEDEDDDEKYATATKEHYRDRAQERREGKNVDYQESQVLLETVKKQASASEGLDETELSKFLGGDEAHTHLVKGLDVALAQTVRQKMQEQQEGTVDRGEEEDEQDTGKQHQPKSIDTKDGAREYVLSSSSQPAGRLSALGRSVLPYLQHKLQPQDPKTVTGAGAAIHRSQLVFCVDWNPQNLALSWEVPSEKSRAAATVQATHHGTGLTKASPLTRELIHQMKKRFQKSNNGITIIATAAAKEQQGSGPKTVVENDDSSDDDIFPATGD